MKELQLKMEKAVEHTSHSLGTIHTGKASPSMVENITVEVYGANMRIREVAAITTPDPRMIVVQPWDKSALKSIEKAIQAANIGLNPVVDGAIVRCPIPELSRERRQDLVKVSHHMAEEGRVSIRTIRRDAIDLLKKTEKAGTISEDDLARLEKEVQHLTDKSNNDIAHLVEKKEKELTAV